MVACPEPSRGEPSVQDALIQHQLRLHGLPAERRHAELALGLLIHYGPLKQAELEARMSSDSAARQGVRRLGALGIIEGEDRHPLTLDRSKGTVAGIDFGRRHIRVLLADLAMNEIGSDFVDHVPVVESGRESIEQAASMVRGLLSRTHTPHENVLGVGVALCGPWRQDLRVAPSSVLTGWSGIHPEDELKARLWGIPVIADNDANLGALGEVAGGAARGCGNIVYLLPIGGVGCGLIVNGMIHRGATGLAGEVGHTIIDSTRDPTAQQCQICHQYCLDDLFVGRKFVSGLANLEQEELDQLEASRRATGMPLSGDERLAHVVRRALEGNLDFRTRLVAATRSLAIVLANLCMVVDPEQIVIGGHLMANAADMVLEPLRLDFSQRYQLQGRPEAARVSILPAERGEDSQVWGAAALVLREPNAELLEHRRRVLKLDLTPSAKAEEAWRERRAGAGRRS